MNRTHVYDPERVVDLAIEIQQVAAPTFAEFERARFVAGLLSGCGAGADVITHEPDVANVYARIPGADASLPALVVSAHTDTVFPASVDLAVTRDDARVHGPGIGDNSLAVAALVALCCAAAGDGAPGAAPCDIWFVANAGEEGLGDLRGIKSAIDHIRSRHEPGVGAAVVLEGMALGWVYRAGIGVKRYRLSVTGPGGHSWGDAGRPSAIHHLARVLGALAELDLPNEPKSSLNIGTVAGGTSINTIAPSARADVDLRSEDANGLAALDARFGAAIASVELPPSVTLTTSSIGFRPAGAIPEDHPLVLEGIRALESVGIEPRVRSGSTDVNALLAAGVPAICVGVSTGDGAHTVAEYIDTAPVADGMRQLARLLPEAARIAAGQRGAPGAWGVTP